MLTAKIDKEIRIGWNKRRGQVSVIREHYLRGDIPCRSQLCTTCDHTLSDELCTLNQELLHYAIPDVEMVEQFHEVLQHPSLNGIILTQTASNHLKSKNRRLHSRFMQAFSVPSKSCIIFSNEHQMECFTPRKPQETLREWQQRLILRVVLWYSKHLESIGTSHVQVILLTEFVEVFLGLLEGFPSIKVLSLSDYLQHYWSHDNSLIELYESVQTSLKENLESCDGEGSYTEYLEKEKIRQGTKEGLYQIGKLRVNRYHPRQEAYVTPLSSPLKSDVINDSLSNDILIVGGTHRNRAINEDCVVVELLPRSKWKGKSKLLPTGHSSESHDQSYDSLVIPTGKIVGIMERASRDIVASFPEEGLQRNDKLESILVVPYDVRFPKIKIRTRLASQLSHHRIVVRIDKWDIHSHYPEGHFVRSIGPIGDIETETQAILIEHQLSTGSFSQAILSELPKGLGWMINEEEIEKRSDLRSSHLIFSIDPKGCEDVDDTLSVRLLKKGGIELGVHIADVSYFVPAGSYTDREAKERGTTIYLADRRCDMLPLVLSSDLCSLLSDVDRYAVSVIWKLNSSYEVEKVWYGRTIIRSAYKLTYEVAQDLFDGKPTEEVVSLIPELQGKHMSYDNIEQRVCDLRQSIRQLVDIARVLREQRNKQGALELEGIEVKVQMIDKENIEDIIPKQPLEMHETIAECMIFANHWVAKKIYETHPTCALLRHHHSPQQDRFNALHTCAKAKGYYINTESNLSLAKSLDNAVDSNDPEVNKVLRMLATQAMVQAMYFSTGSVDRDQFSHYGLGLDLYTHFTSPIRRYADLVVHRQLLASLDEGSPHQIPTDHELQDICNHINIKKRTSQFAQIASTELFQALYFIGRDDGKEGKGERCEAIVYSIRANGVFVYIPRYGVKGPVYLKNKNELVATPDKDTNNGASQIIWKNGTITSTDHTITVAHAYGQYTLRLFDHIQVRIKVDRPHAHAPVIGLELVRCHALSLAEIKNDKVADEKQIKREIIEIVKSEATAKSDKNKQEMDFSPATPTSEYHQQQTSLYTIIDRMRCIGLRDTDKGNTPS